MSDGPIPPYQNRDLDQFTVERYCTGCPYKAVKPRNRNAGSNGSVNITEWGNEGLYGAPMSRVSYYCTSPNYNIKTMNMYRESSTIGVGYCPFFLDKWKQLESNHYPDDPPTM